MNPPWAHNNKGRNGLVRHSCGLVWYQTGEATSHCARCHATFASLDSFDRHFIAGDCVHPKWQHRFEQLPVKHPEHETVTGYWSYVRKSS